MGWQTALMNFLLHTYPSFTWPTAMRFPVATALLMSRHRQDVDSGGMSPQNPMIRAMQAAADATRAQILTTHTLVQG